MHILVLQHVHVEHPGILRSFLARDGHSWNTVELDEGEPVPRLDGYEALWVMGGPMDVWQEELHPWLREEKQLVREAVKIRGMPFLGLCLGHQLMAEALGGEVRPSRCPEIGVMDVRLTEEGIGCVWMDGLPESLRCLQWHSAEVTEVPEGARVLASSPACAVQAMKWGPYAYSAQFHVEIESDTVSNWARIPEYAAALRAELGPDGITKMRTDAERSMRQLNETAERLYMNWLRCAAGT